MNNCCFSFLGCVLPFEEVTSRTFASLQSSCSNSCDMHRVLQEASERFRKHRLNFVLMKEHHDDVVEHRRTNSVRVSQLKSQRSSADWSGKKFYCPAVPCVKEHILAKSSTISSQMLFSDPFLFCILFWSKPLSKFS